MKPYVIPSEPVASSNIRALGYDADRRVLAVTFKSGDVFHYADVPSMLAFEFYTADSKGRFYVQQIKGKFHGQKMTGRCPQCGDGPGVIGLRCEDCGTADYAEAPKAEQKAS